MAGAEPVAGIELPAGEPQAIADAAVSLGKLAGGFGHVAASLRSAAGATPSWSGLGAEAARASLEGCAQAADASRGACLTARVQVQRYALDFEEAHGRVKRLQEQAGEVEEQLETARREAAAAGRRAEEARGRAAAAMVATPVDIGGAALAAQRDATREAEAAEQEQRTWGRRANRLEQELEDLREKASRQRQAAREAEDRAEAVVVSAQDQFPAVPAGAGPAAIPTGGEASWPFAGPLAPPGPLFGPFARRSADDGDSDDDPPGGPVVPPVGGPLPFAGPLVPPGPLFGRPLEPQPGDDDGDEEEGDDDSGPFDPFSDALEDAGNFAADSAREVGDAVGRPVEDVAERYGDAAEDVSDWYSDRVDDASDLVGGDEGGTQGDAPEPGSYVHKNESMSDFSRRYQEFNGARPGETYRVEGPSRSVDFDSHQDGKLIESKGHYDQFFEPNGEPKGFFDAPREFLDQAEDQAEAADGRPVEWRFAERGPAYDWVRREIRLRELPIDVRHVPMPE